MNPSPITWLDRISMIAASGFVAALIYGIAFLIWKANSRKANSTPRERRDSAASPPFDRSVERMIQGKPTPMSAAVCYWFGATFGAYYAVSGRDYLHEVSGGFGGFGLIAGLIIGNVIGLFQLRTWRKLQAISETVSITNSPLDSNNPYATMNSVRQSKT
jgi:hypothetical protein